MNKLWDYPNITYDEAKKLAGEGKIKSRLIQLRDFDRYIYNTNIQAVNKLTLTYYQAVLSNPSDTKLRIEFYEYLGANKDQVVVIVSILGDTVIIPTYIYTEYLNKYLTLDDIEDILTPIKSLTDNAKSIILNIALDWLIETQCNKRKVIDKLLNIVLNIMGNDVMIDSIYLKLIPCIDIKQWGKVESFKNTTNLPIIINYSYEMNVLRKVMYIYNKSGYSCKYIIYLYLGSAIRRYDVLTDLLYICNINMMNIYKETTSNYIKNYIGEIILNQI